MSSSPKPETEERGNLPTRLSGTSEHDVVELLFELSFWGFKDFMPPDGNAAGVEGESVFQHFRQVHVFVTARNSCSTRVSDVPFNLPISTVTGVGATFLLVR